MKEVTIMINFDQMMSNMKQIVNFADLIRSYGGKPLVLDECEKYSIEKIQMLELAIYIGKECCEDGIKCLTKDKKMELFNLVESTITPCNSIEDFTYLLTGNTSIIKYLTRFVAVFYEDVTEILNNSEESYYNLLSNNTRDKLYCDCCGEEIVGTNGMMVWVEKGFYPESEVCDVRYGHYGVCNYIVEKQMENLSYYGMTSGLDSQLYSASGLEKFIDHVSDRKLTESAIRGLSRIYGKEIIDIFKNNNLRNNN